MTMTSQAGEARWFVFQAKWRKRCELKMVADLMAFNGAYNDDMMINVTKYQI